MSLKMLLVCDDKSDHKMTQELIAAERSLTLVDTVRGSQSIATIKSLLPELVWIHLQTAPVRGLSLLAELRKACPEVSFLVSYHNLDSELMRTAYRLGASDFLDPVSWKSDLATSVKRIETWRALQGRSNASAKVSAAPSEKARPLSTLLVCDAGKEKRHTIEALIKGRKQLSFSGTVSTANAVEKARLLSPKLIWIELSPDPQHALSVLADLKEKSPHVNIFVSHDAGHMSMSPSITESDGPLFDRQNSQPASRCAEIRRRPASIR